jgi:glycosyltransferase involved in cell wall biosynthesis
MNAADRPKKLLVLAWCFPPAWEVGKFRVAKFVKYLQRDRVEPVVITVERQFAAGGDRSLDQDIHGVRRIPLRTWPGSSPAVWLLWLLLRLPGILRRERPDMLFGTGSPFLPLVCLPLLKRWTGRPYIVDLRDPWALHPQYSRTTGRMRNRIRRWLERYVVRHADHVLVVTETMRRMYAAHYTDQASKFVLISNGFDPEDVERLPAVTAGESDPRRTLVYAGKFAAIRSPQPLLEALQADAELAQRVRIEFIGPAEPHIVQLVQQSGLQDAVRFRGQLSYQQTLSAIRSADAGLIFGTYEAWEPTTKVYDYMMVRRPVFAMTCRQGEVAATLADYGAGVVSDARGGELARDLQSFLAELDEWQQRAANANPAAYDRRIGAQRLATLIHRRAA